MTTVDLRLVDASKCDDRSLAQAAALVCSSLPDFYDLFAKAGVDVQAALARSFVTRGTTIANTTVALRPDGDVVGVMSRLEVAELRRTGYVDLQQLMRDVAPASAPGLRDGLRAHAGKVPAIEGEGRYLARLAVSPEIRGSGLADLLLDWFEEDGSRFFLHVHRANARAIAFYHRRHYRFTSGPETEYRIMSR